MANLGGQWFKRHEAYGVCRGDGKGRKEYVSRRYRKFKKGRRIGKQRNVSI